MPFEKNILYELRDRISDGAISVLYGALSVSINIFFLLCDGYLEMNAEE